MTGDLESLAASSDATTVDDEVTFYNSQTTTDAQDTIAGIAN